jgi:hypothetical protein
VVTLSESELTDELDDGTSEGTMPPMPPLAPGPPPPLLDDDDDDDDDDARLSKTIRKTEWLRLLVLFMPVLPTLLLASPASSNAKTSSGHVTISSRSPRTTTPSVRDSNIRTDVEGGR